MNRSLKKGRPFVCPKLEKKFQKWIKEGKSLKTIIRTWSRKSTILPEFVGCRVQVHNGKDFWEFQIQEDHIGHKFGEFAFTRKYAAINHKKVKKKPVQSRH